eukprot:9327950-Pyramimonas_sp.AAC.1
MLEQAAGLQNCTRKVRHADCAHGVHCRCGETFAASATPSSRCTWTREKEGARLTERTLTWS